MASQLASYLPPVEGLLPKWLLLTSIISIANSIQAYSSVYFTQRVYNGPSGRDSKDISKSPVTPLSARTFGTWTFLSSIIRLYAAYNLDDGRFYQLALWTYGAAWVHFMSEWVVFRTARWSAGLAGPVFVATGTMVWMLTQWENYVET